MEFKYVKNGLLKEDLKSLNGEGEGYIRKKITERGKSISGLSESLQIDDEQKEILKKLHKDFYIIYPKEKSSYSTLSINVNKNNQIDAINNIYFAPFPSKSDGFHRVCHLEIGYNSTRTTISEFKATQGCQYSSFYRVLKTYLDEVNSEHKNSYELKDVVKALNRLQSEYQNGFLKLEKVDETNIVSEQYFNKVYWKKQIFEDKY